MMRVNRDDLWRCGNCGKLLGKIDDKHILTVKRGRRIKSHQDGERVVIDCRNCGALNSMLSAEFEKLYSDGKFLIKDIGNGQEEILLDSIELKKREPEDGSLLNHRRNKEIIRKIWK